MGTDDSEYTVFKPDLKRAQEQLSGIQTTILDFREDLCSMFVEEVNYDDDDVSPYKRRTWTEMGRHGLTETRNKFRTFEHGLNIIDLSDAILSLLLFFLISSLAEFFGVSPVPSYIVALLLSTLQYLMNTGLILAKSLINQIAYPKEEIHTRLPPSELRFRAGWNKGVIQTSSSLLGLIVLGMISSPGSKVYEHSLKFIRLYVRWRAP